jgi:NAD(P)H dehydrogenase (quinone)
MGLFDKITGKVAAKDSSVPRGIVVYDSKTGNTEKMALAISQGMQQNGVDTRVKRVDKATLNDLMEADAIVLGSPTYFANMTTKMKDFIDKSIKIYPDKLADKAGAAFTVCDGVGGDMTVLAFLQAMLLHRMVVIGPESGGFGAVQVGDVDEKCLSDCQAFGNRIAAFTVALEAGKEKLQVTNV